MHRPWRFVLLVLFLVAAITHQAHAEVNLAWSPQSATVRDPGTWQLGAETTLVICRTQSSQGYTNAPITTFGACTTEVYACTVERAVGAGEGCPPGSFSGERFIPKAQVATAAPLPPPTPPSPTITLTVSPVAINRGESATITWTAINTLHCGSSFAGTDHALSGSVQITPATSMTHVMGCDSLPGASSGASASVFILVNPPFTSPEPPPCWPLPGTGVTLYETQTVDGHTVKVWGCDMPEGFVWRPVGFDPSRLVERLACVPSSIYAALTSTSLAEAWRACVDRPFSPTEGVVADALTQRWKPRFAVQGGSTVVRRPVYIRNADGTRGLQLRIDNVLQYVVPGIACDGRARLLGISTRYHLVAGAVSQAGATLPADSFAQCVMNQPPADGWQ